MIMRRWNLDDEVDRANPMKPPGVTFRRDFLRQLTARVILAATGALKSEAVAASSRAAVLSAPETYTNPVYAGSMPDPFVLRHRGGYYAFGTIGGERKTDGRIFTLLRSTNLVEWHELGGALIPPTTDAAYQYWAPEAPHSRKRPDLKFSV